MYFMRLILVFQDILVGGYAEKIVSIVSKNVIIGNSRKYKDNLKSNEQFSYRYTYFKSIVVNFLLQAR
jgi:hypothetical protein